MAPSYFSSTDELHPSHHTYSEKLCEIRETFFQTLPVFLIPEELFHLLTVKGDPVIQVAVE